MTLTPMMAQWKECKEKAKESLLFFRLGDFYEAFFEDAQVMSKELSLTLTARQAIPMCGVPFHTAEVYIDKLVAKGFKVAIAEQIEDPKEVKGLVKRDIVRIVSPGTLVGSQLLSDKKNNFFASVARAGKIFGLGLTDLSTGEFQAMEMEREEELLDELFRKQPAEILISPQFQESHPLFLKELSHGFAFSVSQRPQDLKTSQDALSSHFKEPVLQGQSAAILAAGALIAYLKEELGFSLQAASRIQNESLSRFMAIDRSSLRNLELTESATEGKYTLFDFLDETKTAMGARLLRRWLKQPLLNIAEIASRQDAVAALIQASLRRTEARERMGEIRDLERLAIKISTGYATPRDLLSLGLSLAKLEPLKEILSSVNAPKVRTCLQELFDSKPLAEEIISSLNDTLPIRIGEGDLFKDGYNSELDLLRKAGRESVSWMAHYQNTLREETGIRTLKVGYTKAFGYYIETSRVQSEKIPASFQRRQTLVNGERFVTDELKEFERRALSAEEKSKALEALLYEQLRQKAAEKGALIRSAARAIAELDLLSTFALLAEKYKLARPVVDDSPIFTIVEGRHPIVEKMIGAAGFIPNDTNLSIDRQMMLITGPNMAGKSTYIRQNALIAILAQMGSYIPAKSAHIGVIDKVFSRIGASDDLARGQSTFMVEMSETAYILNQATSRSLVLLDEIGRGTSTYDGIAIAWAVAEYLLTTAGKQAKTLFATHYWELTRLEAEFPRALNFQTAVRETSSGVVFLRKITHGGTDKSYGIHVAKLAGLPSKAIQRAEKMLAELEEKSPRRKESPEKQLSLFASAEPPALTLLRNLDLNRMTPIEAHQKLLELQKALN